MPQEAQKIDQVEIWMSALDIALPLYTRAAFPKLRACVYDMNAGRDLSRSVKGKSKEWAERAAKMALKAGKVADEALIAEVDELLQIPFDGLDDFSLATLAQVLFERAMNEDDSDTSKKMFKRNASALNQVAISNEVSPLVDYEWLVTELEDNTFFEEETGGFVIL